MYGFSPRAPATITAFVVTLVAFATPILIPAEIRAQQPRGTLPLEAAIDLALRNNPAFQAQLAEEADADWAVREAFGALLPGASANMGFQYQASGEPRFGTITGADFGVQQQPSFLLSDYTLGVSYQFGGHTVYRPGQARAERNATLARIDAARASLVAEVNRQYLAVLRAGDAVELAEQELGRAADNARLAEAHAAVGAAAELDARQAELERGRAEVALLQAENELEIERLRLMERLGIDLDAEAELTTAFEVVDLPWTQEELTGMALGAHPELRSLRAAGEASEAGLRIARSAYLPTVDFSAGYSGFTRQARNTDLLISQARGQAQGLMAECQRFNEIYARLNDQLPQQNCAAFQLTPAGEEELLRRNRVFPFDFSRQPLVARLQVSLPIFQGFTRQRQVERARLVAADTRQRLRGEELRVRADVAAAFRTLDTARRTVELEERNVALARDQVRLARDRYELGAINFLELLEAETMLARADRSLLTAVYSFHEGLAALEAAVGRPLSSLEGR